MRKFQFHDAQAGSAITVKVTTHAKKDAITAVMSDGTIKVSVTAKPVQGAANEALIAFLAAKLGLPKSQIDIVAGAAAQTKLISILGLPPDQVEARLKPEEHEIAKEKGKAKGREKAQKKKASRK
ncbi:MAG: DUF167 domain-containing protein [Chloroflexi bacterium]|nr:DUF167 domain-containing protein [Chloroflexota bacterium]